jgi:predicted MFS family arabinose efflux permease
MAVALVTLAFAPSWPWAVAGSLGAGLGFYMLHNTLQVNATQMAPQRRGAAVSAFAACFFLGQSVGVTAAGWWVEQAGSQQALALGALGTLAVALNFGRLLVRRG